MKKTRSTRPQKGDIVKIINPEFFLRCGYPLTPFVKEVKEKIEGLRLDLNDFIHSSFMKLGIKSSFEKDYIGYVDVRKDRATEAILKELAYLYCKENSFGGNSRNIYTARIAKLKGTEFVVNGYKVCYTGTRDNGSYDPYYDDYEPPYLGDVKYHHMRIGDHLTSLK